LLQSHLCAPGSAQSLDTGFEGCLQLIAITSNYSNSDHPYRSQDQGILGKVLPIFFTNKAFD
jgi:hypothetical protein